MGTFVQKGSLVFFWVKGRNHHHSIKCFFGCCCSCGSIVKEMIPIVIQKYHCSAFNSILFSEMIKTWQTQTDRQSFFFLIYQKMHFPKVQHIFVLLIAKLLASATQKNVSRISFQKKKFQIHPHLKPCIVGFENALVECSSKTRKSQSLHARKQLSCCRPTNNSFKFVFCKKTGPANQPTTVPSQRPLESFWKNLILLFVLLL